MLLSLCLLYISLYFKFTFSSDSFNYYGCINKDSISGLSSQGQYIYQSVDYCQNLCPNSNVVALYNGNECFCGELPNNGKDLNSLTKLSQDQCNVACAGWPYQTCGGSNAWDVYVNSNVEDTEIHSGSESTNTWHTIISSTPVSSTFSTSNKISSSPVATTGLSKVSASSPNSAITSQSTSKPTNTIGNGLSATKKSINTESESDGSAKIITPPSSSPNILSTTSTTKTSLLSKINSPITTSTPTSKISNISSTLISKTPSAISSKTVASTNALSKPSDIVVVKTTKTAATTEVSYQVITSVQYATNIVTQSVVSKIKGTQTTIFVTATTVNQITSTTAVIQIPNNANSNTNKGLNNLNKNSLSGGDIAGIVIGIVFGLLLIILILGYLLWYRKRYNKNKEKEFDEKYNQYKENIQHNPYSFGDNDHLPTEIPIIHQNNANWLTPNTANTDSSFADGSHNSHGYLLNDENSIDVGHNTEPMNQDIENANMDTNMNSPNNFHGNLLSAPFFNNKDIFSATSLVNNQEGALHIVNPDQSDVESSIINVDTNASTGGNVIENSSSNSNNDNEEFSEKI